ITRTTRLRRLRLVVVTRFELLDVVRDLVVLRDDLFEVLVELLAGLLEVVRLDRGPEQHRDAADERERRFGILDPRDVVGHVRPQGRGRESLLPADRVEYSDDAGGTLVAGRPDAEKGADLRVGCAARETNGPGVGYLREECAQGQHQTHLTAPGQLEDQVAVGLPAQM